MTGYYRTEDIIQTLVSHVVRNPGHIIDVWRINGRIEVDERGRLEYRDRGPKNHIGTITKNGMARHEVVESVRAVLGDS